MRRQDPVSLWRPAQEGNVGARGRRPNQFDWFMLISSFVMIAWIVLTH